MKIRWNRKVLIAAAAVIVLCAVVSVQPQGNGEGEWINFPNTSVGQTQTVPFTYTLLESSATPAMVTVSSPFPPFGVGGSQSFTLSPGESRQLSVTFSPTEAGTYEGAFSITAVGGIPPQVMTTNVYLTGTGVTGTSLFGDWNPFLEIEPVSDSTESELLEAKLDGVGVVLSEFRTKLDNLGYWLGQLIAGYGIGIEPTSTNPPIETSLWDMLAALEAKLDYLLMRPGEIMIGDVYNIVIEMNVLIVEINQWVINLGGNVAGLETKLDGLQADLDSLYDDIDDIYGAIFGTLFSPGILDGLFGSGGLLEGIYGEGGVLERIAELEDLIEGPDETPDETPEGMAESADALAVLEAKADADATVLASLEAKADADATVLASLEAKADANAAAIALNAAAIAANNGLIVANGAAIGVNGGLIAANGAAIGVNNGLIAANGAAIAVNNGLIAANGAAIGANAAAIAANARAIQALQDSVNRIEDMLKQQQGYPAAPDASKVTLTMGGGPLPSVPWEATVAGTAGAVSPDATVTIYWPIALPPSTVTADGSGAFTLTVTTGSISYWAVDVTQTVGGKESARVRIPAS